MGLGDYLAQEFGEWDPARHKFRKIELCHFTNTLKPEIFCKLRMAFEQRSLRVPVSRVIREDLHSVNRISSPTGQITYRAPHSAGGHADRCAALALAVRAGGDGQRDVRPCIESWNPHDQSEWPWKNIRRPHQPGGHPLWPWVL